MSWQTKWQIITLVAFTLCAIVIGCQILMLHSQNKQIATLEDGLQLAWDKQEEQEEISPFVNWASCVEGNSYLIGLMNQSGMIFGNQEEQLQQLSMTHCTEQHEWDPPKIRKWMPEMFS